MPDTQPHGNSQAKERPPAWPLFLPTILFRSSSLSELTVQHLVRGKKRAPTMVVSARCSGDRTPPENRARVSGCVEPPLNLKLSPLQSSTESKSHPKKTGWLFDSVPGPLRLVLASLGLAQGITLDARKGREIRDPLGCPEPRTRTVRGFRARSVPSD